MLSYNYYLRVAAQYGFDSFTSGSDSVFWGANWVQCYPGIGRDASVQYDIEKPRSRRLFNGNLVFVNRTTPDYTRISDIISPSAEVELRIEQVGATTASDWWSGYFSIIDGAWDSDRGIFSVTPIPNDSYRPLEEQGDKVFNLITDVGGNDIQATMEATISITYIDSVCDHVEGSSVNPTNITDWQTTHPTFPKDETGDDTDSWDKFTFCSADSACPAGFETWTWAKVVSDIKLDDTFVLDEVNENYYSPTCTEPSSTLEFPERGFLLNDVIAAIVNELGDLTYKSSFFNNDDFSSDYLADPLGTPTTNYVTTADPNPLLYLVLYQKSDTKSTSDPATKAEITFNELMDILKKMFNVDWYIDPEGYFRIEHVSYFAKEVDVDLVTDFPTWIAASNKWSYDIEAMPNREHFEWMESDGIDFIGKDIIYDRIATGNRYKDNQVDRIIPVTTDAKYLYGYSSEVADIGWAIFQCDSNYVIQAEVGVISWGTGINAHLSWANLHDKYWIYDRVISTGNMNGSDYTFETWQKNIKQVDITYPACQEAFNTNGLKTTYLGDGEVREAEYKMVDGTIKTVFFYLDVKIPDPPPTSTYHIKYSYEWDILTGTLDNLIFYG